VLLTQIRDLLKAQALPKPATVREMLDATWPQHAVEHLV
jgi:hypothetical protein